MKWQNIHEIIPEKSEEDFEFTISIKNDKFDNNNDSIKKEKVLDFELEEKTEGDYLDNNKKSDGKEKQLLININKQPDKNESLNKSKNKSGFTEDSFIKKFNSEHGNRSVSIITKSEEKRVKYNKITNNCFYIRNILIINMSLWIK